MRLEVEPEIFADHDEEKYHIEIELPGVKKEDIDLTVNESSFCVKASKGEDIIYNACYALAHDVNIGNIKANFDNGLLTILAPFKESLRGTKITIE